MIKITWDEGKANFGDSMTNGAEKCDVPIWCEQAEKTRLVSFYDESWARLFRTYMGNAIELEYKWLLFYLDM